MAPIAGTGVVSAARSLLFVPGSRPDRYAKAAASGADLVLVDLEDAVAPADKELARSAAAGWLAADGVAAVRINGVGTPHHAADVEALATCPGVRALVVPKAERPDDLTTLSQALGADAVLLPQVESACGVLAAPELARAPAVARLLLGHLDLAADLDADPESATVAQASTALVVASRAAGLPGPVASVTTDLDDPLRAGADARRARSLGFTGKLCVHPRQVAPVHDALTPGSEEVAWAERVLSASKEGAVRLDGEMVDAPVVARAESVLARVRRAP